MKTICHIIAVVLCILKPCTLVAQEYREVQKPKGEELKELMEKCTQEYERSHLSITKYIKEFEQIALQCQEPAEKMVIHSIIAELYSYYIDENIYKISKRTSIADGKEGDKIEEWSYDKLFQTFIYNIKESLKDYTLLSQTPNNKLFPLIEQQDGGSYYNHDLLHIISDKCIRSLERCEYGQMRVDRNLKKMQEEIFLKRIETYRNASNENAVILSTFDYLKNHYGNIYTNETEEEIFEQYLNSLRELLAQCDKSNPFCTEIYIKLAYINNYLNNPHNEEIIDYCNRAIKAYPTYPRTKVLEQIKSTLLAKSGSISFEEKGHPEKEIKIWAWGRQMDSLQIEIYRIPDRYFNEISGKTLADSCLKEGTLVGTHLFKFDNKAEDRRYTRIECIIPPLKNGMYVIVAKMDGILLKPRRSYFMRNNNMENRVIPILVSRLGIASIANQNRGEILVTDWYTGKPIKGANVKVDYLKGMTDIETIEGTSNKNGLFFFDFPKATQYLDKYNYTVKAKNGKDKYLKAFDFSATASKSNSTLYYDYDDDKYESQPYRHINLFTDRVIYRPGQKLYVKGFYYSYGPAGNAVVPNSPITLSLVDLSRREKRVIKTIEVITNEFGSFNTTFNTPASALNENYQIVATSNDDFDIEVSKSFRVEEYKRPSFEVTAKAPTAIYSFGDTAVITANAKTLTGIPIKGAKINYTTKCYVLTRPYNMQEIDSQSGTTYSDNNGDIKIPVKIEEKEVEFSILREYRMRENDNLYYAYVTEIFATNAGERQSCQSTIFAGKRGLLLSIDFISANPKARTSLWDDNLYIDKDKEIKVNFKAKNLSVEDVNKELTYKLYRIENRGLAETKEIKEMVLTGSARSNKEMLFSELNSMSSGYYRLEITALDHNNNICSNSIDIALFSKFDKSPITSKGELFFSKDNDYIYFGTSSENATAYLYTIVGGKIIERESIPLSNRIVKRRAAYQQSFKEGAQLLLYLVADGNTTEKSITIEPAKSEETKLKLQWVTFRDRLQPGESEQWKLKILNPNGEGAEAELLAYMYDAALEILTPSVRSNVDIVRYKKAIEKMNLNSAFSGIFGYSCDQAETFEIEPIPSADKFAISLDNEDSQKKKSIFNRDANINQVAAVLRSSVSYSYLKPQQMRSNFEETAFFLPELVTDSYGNVVISFTLPHSLTRWKLVGIAHTKSMAYGTIEEEIIARKEFMIAPNMPRFLRSQDSASITATLTNLTAEDIETLVALELFEPSTDKLISRQEKQIKSAAEKSEQLTFSFSVPQQYKELGIRLIANSDKFSDGEQHIIKVLPNREQITESLAFSIDGEQSKEFSLHTLFNHHSTSAIERELTIEYTNSPILCALQAMQQIAEPEDNCAICQAGSFYSNHLIDKIINSNTYLRDTLLKMFDTTEIVGNKIKALTQISSMQQEDGGWGWFNGMESSPWVSEYVLTLLCRAKLYSNKVEKEADEESEFDEEYSTLVDNGLKYLSRIAEKHLEQIGRDKSMENKSTFFMLRYLYIINSILEAQDVDDYYSPTDVDEYREHHIYTDFLNRVERSAKNMGIQDMAQAAVVLAANGRNEAAQKCIATLKKRIIKSDDLGMFFHYQKNPLRWGSTGLNAQVAAIEAFDKVTGDREIVEQMVKWIIMQKRVRSWETSPQTVDAVDALLKYGNNLFNNNGEATLTFANRVLKSNNKIDHITESYTDPATVNAQTIKVNKQKSGIAWGAVHATFTEKLNKVKSNSNKDISIRKELYLKVENPQTGRQELQPIKEGEKIKVGDIVTSRLIIDLEMEMDFVQIIELKGACFENTMPLSGYMRGDGYSYYQLIKDTATELFFETLNKGTTILEIDYVATRSGEYELGFSKVLSAFAPEFSAHSGSMRITIE